MKVVASELISIGFFVIAGWAALWPLRRRLSAVPYHLAALPTGLLAAPLAGCVSTMTGRPLDVLSAGGGAVLLVAAVWFIQRVTLDRGADAGPPTGIRSFAVATGVIGVTGAILAFARYTAINLDSLVSYWPLGVQLSRKGAYTVELAATRSALIPAMNAIHVTFGSDWAYVIYPMLAATLALWLVMTLRKGPLAGSARRTGLWVSGVAVAFLCVEPSFVFHSFFVHSHMVSALYLLMSLTCICLAVRPDAARVSGEVDAALLILAGIFAAGLALARPDGLAYQFVPVLVAISALTTSKVRWRAVAAFFAPLLFIVLTVYAATYAKLGLWETDKLSGRAALAILAVLALSALGPWIVAQADRLMPFRVSGERFLGIAVSASAILMLAVFALKWESAAPALAIARINLLEGHGGYNYLWYAVVALLVISALTGDALRTGSWTRRVFLPIALFFVIAGLVHGTSHEGRIGVGDSLNRVVFEVFPLVVWYVAAVVARIMGPAGGAGAGLEPQPAEHLLELRP